MLSDCFCYCNALGVDFLENAVYKYMLLLELRHFHTHKTFITYLGTNKTKNAVKTMRATDTKTDVLYLYVHLFLNQLPTAGRQLYHKFKSKSVCHRPQQVIRSMKNYRGRMT